MKRHMTYRMDLVLGAALLTSLWLASSGCAAQAAQQPAAEQPAVEQPAAEKPAAAGPSLYERLGGVNNIAMLMDVVIDRSYADPVFQANHYVHAAHMKFPKPIYKYQATSLACMVTGGPCKYLGRSPKAAHEGLHITEKEWREFIKIFRESMDSFKVPAREQGEVIAILEGAKKDVVVPAESASR